ncbi:MAG TPA: TIGR00295 family protein [Thermoplasmata archaeon]|nr:TIGR00295 family protein [Thermoplasmata archaeon]
MSRKKYPSYEECVRLLKESKCSQLVLKHTLAVYELAQKIAGLAIANGTKVNLELVKSGALLHDLGRTKTHGIRHAVEGAELAKKLGLPREIIGIIEHHIGAGLSREDAEKLGLPPKNYFPKTLEEKIVSHADNLIVGFRKGGVKDIIDRLESRGLKEAADRILALHWELSDLCGADLDHI